MVRWIYATRSRVNENFIRIENVCRKNGTYVISVLSERRRFGKALLTRRKLLSGDDGEFPNHQPPSIPEPGNRQAELLNRMSAGWYRLHSIASPMRETEADDFARVDAFFPASTHTHTVRQTCTHTNTYMPTRTCGILPSHILGTGRFPLIDTQIGYIECGRMHIIR